MKLLSNDHEYPACNQTNDNRLGSKKLFDKFMKDKPKQQCRQNSDDDVFKTQLSAICFYYCRTSDTKKPQHSFPIKHNDGHNSAKLNDYLESICFVACKTN